MRRHGRKQGNGGTREAGRAIDSYGPFRSRQGEEPGGFSSVQAKRAAEVGDAGVADEDTAWSRDLSCL